MDTMRHVFKAKKLGWGDDKTEGVWFDAAHYTKEEAEAEFKGLLREVMTTLGTSMMGNAITITPTLVNSRMMICLPVMPTFGIENRHFPSI